MPNTVIDGHVDLLYLMQQKAVGVAFEDLEDLVITPNKLKDGKIQVIASAFYCPDSYNGPQKAADFLKQLMNYAAAYTRVFTQITQLEDLIRCYNEQKARGMIYLLENADALVEVELETLKSEGFYIVGLTHAGTNRLADGNQVTVPGDLTAIGKKLVKDLHRMQMAIDVAHLAEPCFWQVAHLFDAPLISSHTGFRRFCDLPRNLSDEQLDFIVENQGMVGMTVNPEMLSLSQQGGIGDVVHQIDWVVQRHGSKCIGLGSDFGGFEMENEGLEHPGKIGTLGRALALLGYSDEAIDDICGANWFRFYASLL